jgi:DHA1 family multidrug resistance protein-like MFS transporter
MGSLSARYPLKALLTVGCAIGSAGALGMALSESVLMATILGCLAGVGGGMLVAGSSAYVGSIAPQGRSGAAFGWVQSANAVGFGFGPFVGGSIASAFGLRVPFGAEALLFLGLAALVARLKRP